MIAGQGGKAPEEYWMAEIWKDTTSTFGSSTEMRGTSMQVSESGDCYVAFRWKDANQTPSFIVDEDFQLLKISAKGSLKWHKQTYLHTYNNANSESGTSYLYTGSRIGNGGCMKGASRGNLLSWQLGSIQNYSSNYGGASFVWDASSDSFNRIGHGQKTGSSGTNARWGSWCLTHDKDGNPRTVGTQYDSGNSGQTRTAVSIYGAGNAEFQFRKYNVYPRDILCDDSNNTYVIGNGYFGGTGNYQSQGWLIKLASGSSQTISWYKRIWNNNHNGSQYFNTALRLDSNGKLYWSYGGKNNGNQSCWGICRIDPSNGSIERNWGYKDDQEYGYPHGRFDVDDDGNVYAISSFLTKIELGSNNGDRPHYLLSKRNSSGVLQWERMIIAQYRGASATDTDKIIDKSNQQGFGRIDSTGAYSIDIHNDSIYLNLTTEDAYNMQTESGGSNNYANNYLVNVIMKLPLDGSGHSTTPRALGRVQIIYSDTSLRGSNIGLDYTTGTSSPGSNYYWNSYDTDWQPSSDTTRGTGEYGLAANRTYGIGNYVTTANFNAGYNLELGDYEIPD